MRLEFVPRSGEGEQEAQRARGFDAQFAKKETLVLEGSGGTQGSFEVIDVAPETQKTEVPVLIAPGFGEGPKALELNMKTFYENGKRTLTFDAPHGVRVEGAEKKLDANEFAAREYRKAAALKAVIGKKNLDKVDGVGHSEGCIYLVLAALEHPERFRSLVLVNPGGMVGEDNFLSLVARAYEHQKAQTRQAKVDSRVAAIIEATRGERTKNVTMSPLQSVDAARAIAATQIHELLVDLKSKGIGIAVIHGVHDLIFPMERVQKMAKTEQLDGFYSVKGGHSEFLLHPEQYTRLANHALDALAQKKIRREEQERFQKAA